MTGTKCLLVTVNISTSEDACIRAEVGEADLRGVIVKPSTKRKINNRNILK